MIAVIAPGDVQGARGIQPQCQGGDDDEQGREPRRDKIDRVIQARGELAEIKIALGAVADHGVERIDCFVRHRRWQTAEKKIKERRDDAVAGALGQRFQTGAQHFVLIQAGGLAANDVRKLLSGRSKISRAERRFDAFNRIEQAAGCQSCRSKGRRGEKGKPEREQAKKCNQDPRRSGREHDQHE